MKSFDAGSLSAPDLDTLIRRLNVVLTRLEQSLESTPFPTGITISGITTGSKGYLRVQANSIVRRWSIMADVSGSIVIDVKRSSWTGFPSTTSLVGAGTKPTLSAAQKATGIPDWDTVDLAEGDVLEFVVDSVSTVTRVTLSLELTRQ